MVQTHPLKGLFFISWEEGEEEGVLILLGSFSGWCFAFLFQWELPNSACSKGHL